MDKHRVAAVLEEIAVLLELTGANPFRSRAFANAARSLEALEEDLDAIVRGGRLGEISGIGKGIARDVTDLVTTGRLSVHEELRATVPVGLLDVLRIPGLGSKKVRTLWDKLGVTTLEALEEAARGGRIRGLDGFGLRTEEKILEGIQRVRAYSGRVLWSVASAAAARFVDRLARHPHVRRVAIAGSLRRRLETVHDVDLLAAVDEAHRDEVMDAFIEHESVARMIARGPTKSSVLDGRGLQVDLRAVADDEFPFALHHFTGSKEHNTKLRGRAKSMGLRMSEWGIFRGDERLHASDEEGVFALLGLPFIPPELREDLGEVEAALEGALPTLVEPSAIRGVLHVHTTASDGRATLREMVRAARERGFSFLGISDHSPSAIYANGLDPTRLSAQRREIEEVRREFPDIAILHGVESDILEDGRLDHDDEILAELDFVVASVHSRFGLSREATTERVITAIRHPAVAVLGHPTGRLLLERDGYGIDMERVLEEAGRHGVAVEINASPRRLDLDWRFHRRAIALGVTLSIGPDAHDVEGLDDTWIGLGVARKGWVGPEHLLNCRSYQDMLSFCARRRENWTPARGERPRHGPRGERLA